ncbi:MAG: DNA double-strand break repair nuclease NurA [Candidatus Bathyarchaeia archaeon]
MKQLQSSPLSNAVRRTCNILKQGATIQVLDYEQRFSSLKTLHQSLLTNLIKTEFPTKEAYETAKEFFGTTTVRFAGIDGTMYSRPLFDLVVFFGGAYASTGTITFHEDKLPTVKYDERTAKHGAGISSVVPIYVNEIPDVDQTFFEASQPDEVNMAKPLTEESIINNATVANWIMTFAEYYLAYKLATDNEQKVRIILMDRSLSIERASLLYDTSKRALWEAKSNILGYKIDGEPIDTNELTIARHLVCNTHLGLPPPRADYIRYAIIDLLKRKGALSKKQILAEFGIKDEKRTKRVERNLKNLTKRGFLNEKNEIYTLNSKYAQTWERIKNLVKNIGDRFFFTENPETANLMKIVKDGKEHWLTTLDIAFLTLFTLHMLMEECWNRHILLIGVTKDTAARDFKRQLIPIMGNNDLLNANITSEELEKLPNTDRMILQSTSILNAEKITPPWSLIEYDSAFRTMIPDKQKRKGYVSGAIKNKIGLEKVFLKTYVQLSQAKTDPMLRSNVLLVDRLAYPEYDYKPENIVEFWNELSDGTKEPVEVILYIDKNVPNKLQNLTMNVLVAMAPSNIPEAFGHNTPLFIADKIAKWNYSQFKRIVDTTAEWILNNHKLRRFIFYMSTFRERRTAIEAARREQI